MKRLTAVLALVALASGATAALAHHSFAVFFDQDRTVTITGTVKSFAFRNPHGSIVLEVKDDAGEVSTWVVETNSPGILRRRGWSNDSLKPGDQVTIEGWPARDGKKYLRLRKAMREDGSVIGVPFEPTED